MYKCFECDRPAAHRHHVVPKSRGGTRTVPLCEPCHNKAHHVDRKSGLTELTKEGLYKAKAAGVRLGRPPKLPDQTIALILDLRESGMAYDKIARHLDLNKMPTADGGCWHASTVYSVVRRARSRNA